MRKIKNRESISFKKIYFSYLLILILVMSIVVAASNVHYVEKFDCEYIGFRGEKVEIKFDRKKINEFSSILFYCDELELTCVLINGENYIFEVSPEYSIPEKECNNSVCGVEMTFLDWVLQNFTS